MEIYKLEIILLEVIEVKKKFELFLKKNGLLTLLFLMVVFVASATLFLATRDLGTGSEELDIVEGLDSEILEMDDLTEEELEKEIFNPNEVARLDDEEDEKEDTEEVVDELDEELEEEIEEVEEIEESEEDKEDPDQAEELVEAPKVLSSTPSADNMAYPVEGEVITDFVNDSLVYSETLDEWRTHLGIDIKAALDTTVKAPLNGLVKSVYEDELWGKVIVIDHGNGLESRLANLGTTEMVKEGLEVAKGDHIATVGKSAKIEILMEDHLHFEVIKDGKNIDPRSIIH